MVPQDLAATKRFVQDLSADPGLRSIALLSPHIQQFETFRATFPKARIYTAPRQLWDLNRPTAHRFDLVFAGNVMHYSSDPARWFGNVLSATRYFLVQDLVDRRRSANPPYLGSDGDSTRYEFRARDIVSEHPAAFDLGTLPYCCQQIETYEAGPGARHLIALFEGNPAAGSLAARLAAFPRLLSMSLLSAWLPWRARLRESVATHDLPA
jgi:hypothetical protein